MRNIRNQGVFLLLKGEPLKKEVELVQGVLFVVHEFNFVQKIIITRYLNNNCDCGGVFGGGQATRFISPCTANNNSIVSTSLVDSRVFEDQNMEVEV